MSLHRLEIAVKGDAGAKGDRGVLTSRGASAGPSRSIGFLMLNYRAHTLTEVRARCVRALCSLPCVSLGLCAVLLVGLSVKMSFSSCGGVNRTWICHSRDGT